MKKMTFHTSSEFNAAFEAFQNSNLAKELGEKFRVKPFFEQYAKLKKVVNTASYIINVFAVVTSFVGVFAFIQALVKSSIVAAIFAAIFLCLIEALKRLTIPKAIKDWLQFRKFNPTLTLFSVVFIGLSISLSYSGAHEAVQVFTPQAQTTDATDTKQQYSDRITALEKRQREIKRTMSWKGKLTPQGAKAYNEVTAQIGRIEGDMMQNINRINTNNDSTIKSHSEATTVRSEYFALFTLFFDLMLIFAFAFMEYYDYRSFTEFASHSTDQDSDSTDSAKRSYENENVATNYEPQPETLNNSVATANNGFSLNANTIDLAIKKAKANIAAYTTKLNNNDGRPETNQAGVERWENRLNELQGLQV
jgi:hypothetical protein